VVWTKIELIIWSLFTVNIINYPFRFLQSILLPLLHIPTHGVNQHVKHKTESRWYDQQFIGMNTDFLLKFDVSSYQMYLFSHQNTWYDLNSYFFLMLDEVDTPVLVYPSWRMHPGERIPANLSQRIQPGARLPAHLSRRTHPGGGG
jgi:hypothetical protein